MKKIIVVGVIAFAIGAIISPVAGMAINSTRNLILGMAPEEAILTLADKIDQETGRNDEQEQKLNNLEQINTQQEEIRQQEAERLNQERIADCEKIRQECPGKIKELNDSIGEITIEIIDLEKKINKCKSEDCGMGTENRKGMKLDAEALLSKKKSMLNTLLTTECKDYLNPCE